MQIRLSVLLKNNKLKRKYQKIKMFLIRISNKRILKLTINCKSKKNKRKK